LGLTTPNDLENLFARNDATLTPCEERYDIELPRRERDRSPTAHHRPPLSIDDDIAEYTARLRPMGTAAPERTNTREELARGKGFSKVIVRSGIEPRDAIFDPVQRRENENGQVMPHGARRAT